VAREVRGAVARKLPIAPFFIEDVIQSKALSYAVRARRELNERCSSRW